MNRRTFLSNLIALGVAGYTVDVDRLLWVRGEKTIFIPNLPHGIPLSSIIAAEWARIVPYVHTLFERDELFYKTMLGKDKDFTTDIIINDYRRIK